MNRSPAIPDAKDPTLCQTIRTAWIPTYEVPRVDHPTIPGVTLDMETIGAMPDSATLQSQLYPLVTAYGNWLEQQKDCFPSLKNENQKKTAQQLLQNAKVANDRIQQGIDLLRHPQVFKAFTIANKVVAKARRQQLSQETGEEPASFAPPKWRPFQLAFILLNLKSIVEPTENDRKIVDLLFFPTGGGKTEAYLGLAAFTLVYRRLIHPGITGAGVSIIMRYTLRLLTLDQLEREQDQALGDFPFEIGLWVGTSATPNHLGGRGQKNNQGTAYDILQKFKQNSKQNRSPIPLERCPWCGEKLTPHSFNLVPDELQVRCVNYDCSFYERDLPIVAIDEPIYRRLPCFLIATVDKFAGLPWFGQTGKLFGKVTHYHPHEGFCGPADPNPLGEKLSQGLPPPDLIIQPVP